MQARHQADLTALDMVPAHRNLRDSISAARCDIEHLGIEPESFEQLAGKDFLRYIAAKELESALRIRNPQPGRKAHDTVEDPPEGFTESGLANPDQRSVQRS